MKVRCPECEENFDISVNDYDEGDLLECPECNAELTVEVRNGKLNVMTERDRYFSEYDEMDEFYED